jgi:membrane-associated phospholipid phosphatase
MRADWLTPYMEQFSSLASPVVLFVMCLVITAFAPGKQPGRCALLNLALTLVLNVLLKNLIQRPRPEGFRLIAETGYSFPSGHSMVSMAFYGLVLWMVWHYERDKVLRSVLCALFALTILMVGVSRIYLGVHYASDVVAGFAVSLLWLAFYTKTIVPLFMGAHQGKA